MPLKPIFDPKDDCICRKSFTIRGKAFEAGDPFPWKDLGIPDMKAKKMYHAGYFALASDPALVDNKNLAPGKKEPDNDGPTYKELQAMCKKAGMSASGTTDELTERLKEYDAMKAACKEAGVSEDGTAETLDTRLNEYNDMKELCKEQGLDDTGTMQELEDRYTAHEKAKSEE